MNYTLFKTRWGWCGIVGEKGLIRRIVLPSENKKRVEQKIREEYPEARLNKTGLTQACRNIRSYLAGRTRRLPLRVTGLSGLTAFERRVYAALRRVPYGARTTYGALARAVGKPRAGRAVGNVMAKNPWPLVIPCHRVIKADGALGNFSALAGSTLKRRLLDLEARTR